MSVKDCLDSAHTQGEISRDERDAIKKLYDELLAHYGRADKAKAEMVARLMRQASHGKRQALLSEDARAKIERFLLGYRNARGEPDPAAALVALMEHNGTVRMPEGVSSVAGREKAITGLAMAKMEGLLYEFRRTAGLGQTRNLARLENVVREARGEKTGDPRAAGLAQAWTETSEWLRQRFNAAGGAIGHLEHWGLPQVHDRAALMRRGKDAWIADITPRLELGKMKHALTGEPMTQGDLRASLDWIYRNITTDGWHERLPSAQRTGLGAISGQRADHRFLVFKSADDWLAYNRDYGGGADPFAAMMEHVRGMARDIAVMEVLGPNPAAMLVYLQNFVMRQAALKAADVAGAVFPSKSWMSGREFKGGEQSWFRTRDPEDYARRMVNLSQHMYDLQRGAANPTENERIGTVFDTLRNLNVTSKLGSALFSSLSDPGHQAAARMLAGMPIAKMTLEYGAQVFSGASRREAAAAGIIIDTSLNILHKEARWSGGLTGPAWTQWAADRTLAWSLLTPWTQAGQNAWGMGVMAHFRQNADRGFAQLDAKTRRFLEAYGLTARDWDAIRSVTSHEHLIRPPDVLQAMEAEGRGSEQVAERYMELIAMSSERAVPKGTRRAEAEVRGGKRRGNVYDELTRSMLQFKMFALTTAIMNTQTVLAHAMQDGVWQAAGYAAALLIGTTILAGLGMQLREYSQGKTAREVDPRTGHGAKFWGAAILQGGGLGIYGDFLASEQSRTTGRLADAVAGPLVGSMANLLALTSGNIGQSIRGEKTNAGRELVQFLRGNVPFGTLWYSRLGWERVVLDRLQRELDPEAQQAFRRRIQRQRKDIGNDFWAPPGR